MVFSSNPYLRLSGGSSGTPIYLVVGNSAANAITEFTANSGNIISEGEYNYVKWNISSTVGNYTIPYYAPAPASVKFPLTLRINLAGTGGGSVLFSTYGGLGNAWSNLTNLPTSPAGMNFNGQFAADDSPYAIDRFWIIDASTYGVPANKPTITSIDFGYIESEWTQAANTGIAPESDLFAQRWNSTVGTWADWVNPNAPQSINTATNVQSTGALGNTSFFRVWTLVDKSSPLPVTWLDLSSDCDDGNMIVKWSTATEQNADYFTLERSIDGNNFSSVATVQATGNSSTTQYYSAVDADAYSGTSYYRVKETDFNGAYMYSSTITVNGCSNNISMAVYPNPSLGSFNVAVAGGKDDEVIIVVVDMLGQVFYSNVSVLSTDNEIIAVDPAHQLAAGVYTVIATSNDEILKKKIVIQ